MARRLEKFYFVFLMVLCFALILTSCKKKCEHKYDNACDSTCNLCEELREVGDHDFNPADCFNAKTCKLCGFTAGEALGHTGNTDDGDCTTEVNCIRCGEVVVAATEHSFNGMWQTDETSHWKVCENENCNVSNNKITHTHEEDDDCTTSVNCLECDLVLVEARENHEDQNIDGVCDYCVYKFDYIFDEPTNTYIVFNAEGLYEWANNLWKGVNLTLVRDIELPKELKFDIDNDGVNDSNWEGVRTSCTIEGNGYSIKGLIIKHTLEKDFQGFITRLDEGGKIRNLRLDNVDINIVGINIGALVGVNGGIIENCSVSGNIYVEGHFVGGIVGMNNGTVVGSYNEATVFATSSHVGGICGQNHTEASIFACYNLGNIQSNSEDVGGIVGILYGGQVSGNYNMGKISGTSHTGFIVGYNFLTDETATNYSIMSSENLSGQTPTNCVIIDGTTVTWSIAKDEMNKVLAELQVEWYYIDNENGDSTNRPLIVSKA